jgi:hypothetical protein
MSAALAIDGLKRFAGGSARASPHFGHWLSRLDRCAVPGTHERIAADGDMAILAFVSEGRWAEGWALFDRAVASARQLKDYGALRDLAGQGIGFASPGHWRANLALASEIMDFPRDEPSLRANRQGRYAVAWRSFFLGDRAGVEREWREGEELAVHSGEASRLLDPLLHEGQRLLLAGDLEGAVAAGERLIARADELGSSVAGRLAAYMFVFRALLELGRGEEALASAFSARQRGGWAERPD